MKDLVFNNVSLKKLKRSSWYYDDEKNCYVNVISDEDFKKLSQYSKDFMSASYKVRDGFIEMGKALFQIQSDKLYRYCREGDGCYGYSSFYGFCQKFLGISKSTAANLISVYERFGEPKTESDRHYLQFGFSQLLEMKDMTEGIEKMEPYLSVRKIRLLKNFYKNHGVNPESTVQSDIDQAVEENKRNNALTTVSKANLQFIPGDESSGALSEEEVEGIENVEDEDDQTDQPNEESAIDESFVQEIRLKQVKRSLNDLMSVNPSFSSFGSSVLNSIEDGSAFKPLSSPVLQAKSTGQTSKYHIELPNDKKRSEWLDSYQSFDVLYEIPEFKLTFYRYEFFNGDVLVVTRYIDCSPFVAVHTNYIQRYCIMKKDNPEYDFSGISRTAVLEYLSKNRDTI